ncbi:uncharacterized protein LOC143295896 isoform X2 [Babylonia areolata]|uniref:uncharacterized protein LOC143295896 isoform X2 n=1 Tax=Babylonia areolata TaxID=304850 RepID=UPI003FCF8E82
MTESRNEIARKASKNRRDNEALELKHLTELLPLPREIKAGLDKESIVRLVIGFFRLRYYLEQQGFGGIDRARINPAAIGAVGRMGRRATRQLAIADGRGGGEGEHHDNAGQGGGSSDGGSVSRRKVVEEGPLLLEALRGFALLLNKKGKVLFVSANVHHYLGLSQEWMLERSIVEFIHPEDVQILIRQFHLSAHLTATFPLPASKNVQFSSAYSYDTFRKFFLRMRHYPDGGGIRKTNNYLVVEWTGQLQVARSHHAGQGHRPRGTGMVCVCRPLQPPASLLRQHVPLGGNMFISRHDMRLAYIYCDPRVQVLIGYDPCELLGRTVYQFHNPADAHKCSECHSSLIKTGTGVSRYYRYLGKTGVWVWLQTRATIVSDTRGKPQYVVCNNFVISQKEGDQTHQMELQQQVQTQGQQGLLASDLLAKGALDLPSLTQVTSPASVTDSEHEQHDDTGYSSAVSSMGSTTTSPCPLVGVGGGVELDPCLPSSHRDLGLHPLESKEKDCDELEASLVQGLETAAELGFHSTLSSAIYGEFVQDLPSSLNCLPGSGGVEDMADSFDLNPLPPVSDQHSDPFLCEVGSGRGRGEGSLTHVMEDMEVLDSLLQDIGRQCDSSQDVFPASPLAHPPPPQGDTNSVGEAQTGGLGESGESVVRDGVEDGQPPCDASPSDSPQKEAGVLAGGMDSARPHSLLRTLLDKEGEAVKSCPPVNEAWTKSFTAVSLSSASSLLSPKGQTVSAGKKCRSGVVASKERGPRSVEGGKQQCAGGVGVGQQLMVCGGKQVLVPRQLDLTTDHSEEERLNSYGDDLNLPPILPDDLMDFAMQYCDPSTDRNNVQSDLLSEVEAQVWDSMDHLMETDCPCPSSPESQDKAGKDAPEKVLGTIGEKSIQQTAKKVYGDKHGDMGLVRKVLTSAQPAASSPERPSVIQSQIVSSTQQDVKPAMAAMASPGVGGGKVGSVMKDKVGGAVKVCPFPPTLPSTCGSGASSPALTDHRYSSTRTLSPSPGTHPPGSKRMRTMWDKSDATRERSGSENELTCTHKPHSPSSLPTPLSDPPCKGQVSRAGSSPKCGVSSPAKPVSQGSKPSSQPTSPLPAPIPINGGGKPLTAMSELEKHLRGLVAPPDERSKESDDFLLPTEESSRPGSRPFLELLLTGEISHERYRQIDYHLLYQERERRLEENGHSS